ncbi:toxin glutamine deamidase domain-containing protein [Micromonospora sp. NPDC005806]|uniref:toxin glutamine deamidase domain-containing protein n=1 Tax=Micromonospora sp. NPDC005806 TaxID=3364234 RepID=UPI00368C406E
MLAITGELGKVVESCGCDIEGAKLEAWIELGILVVELLSLAVATVLTLGAASPAAGAAVTASRMVVQQIFKRLVAQLARKAIKEGLKEAGERAAKEVVKSGARGLARRAAIGALVEAGQEAGTSLATQAYQNSTGRRDGLDLTEVGGSGLGGMAGGAVAPLAGLGRHAHGPVTQIGERFGREMAGETLAEGAAGLAVGQRLSLEDLARAAVSGASGSATGQADAAMHYRLDGKLAGLASPPVDLSLPSPADAIDTAGLIPSQRTPETVGPVVGDALPRSAAPPDAAVVHPIAAGPYDAAATSLSLDHLSSPVQPDRSAVDASRLPAHPVADLDADRSHAEAAFRPTLSSVTVESPVAGTPPVTVDPKPGLVHTAPTADLAAPSQPAPVHASATPAVVSGSAPVTQPNSPSPVSADRPSISKSGPLTAPLPQHHVRFATEPVPPPSAPGPDDRPTPNPRFPLLESLAPAPRPAHDPSPPLPGPVDPLPPRRSAPQELTARHAAEQDALDRRRYQEYLESQREWYEENRRQQEAEWLRVRADRFSRSAVKYREQAWQLRRNGQELLALQWQTAAHGASSESYELRERAQQVLAGSLVPAEVTVEDNADFCRINDDVADLARGAVETSDHSALTGDGHPPPIDRSRRYGVRGGLRPPLALHQTDLERQMPRNPDGSVLRTADPRHGDWFRLANDGGPLADVTRSINCLDCTLSLYETWVHGRPRVSAPRTFDGYLVGDVRQPVGGEDSGPERVEEITGGRFQDLCPGPEPTTDLQARQRVEQGYRDLHRQLRAGGHGSYAFLITSWEGGGSHAWVALNQNGTVLYLDPQRGLVLDHPLYGHSGVSSRVNVVGIDALVLGPDGRPMPVDGRPPGIYNVLPELPERPEPRRPPAPYDGDEPAPDFNQVYLLGEDTTLHRPVDPPAPGSAPDLDPDSAIRTARLDAHAERIAAGIFVKDAVRASGNLDEIFVAGLTPVELAQHLDPPALRRMVPGLDQAAAGDVARLLGDPRVQQMLDQTWEASPRRQPLLAETLVHQLTQRPELVRMILATPELANSLTARPLTLHHLATHQKAIDVLGEVLDDIAERGAAAVAAAPTPPVLPTPLTAEQVVVSSGFNNDRSRALQPGFEKRRQRDVAYQRQYLDELYEAAAVSQIEVDELGRRLAEASRGAEYRPRPAPKDRKRAEDKVAKYGGNASRLLDLAAGRVSYQRLNDLYASLAVLQDDSRVRIVQFEDRFLTPQKSGYRDLQMILRTSSGHIAEFRLELIALDEVAEWEHSLFEVKRDLEAVATEQGRSVSETESAIRKGIIQRQREYFWAALQSTLDGGRE